MINKKLLDLIGKPCTIIVKNVPFKDERQFTDYFMGILEEIDVTSSFKGVYTRHPITGCLNFFPLENICEISQEQIFYDEKENQKIPEKVNLDYLEDLISKN